MISCRADLFKSLKPAVDSNDQNPIGKNLMLVPNVFGIEDEYKTIIEVVDIPGFGPQVHYKNGSAYHTIQATRFLGCRDGYAFFQSTEFAEIIGNPLVLILDNQEHGNILSIDKGIFKTETGEEFKAEDYDSEQADPEDGNVIII